LFKKPGRCPGFSLSGELLMYFEIRSRLAREASSAIELFLQLERRTMITSGVRSAKQLAVSTE